MADAAKCAKGSGRKKSRISVSPKIFAGTATRIDPQIVPAAEPQSLRHVPIQRITLDARFVGADYQIGPRADASILPRTTRSQSKIVPQARVLIGGQVPWSVVLLRIDSGSPVPCAKRTRTGETRIFSPYFFGRSKKYGRRRHTHETIRQLLIVSGRCKHRPLRPHRHAPPRGYNSPHNSFRPI